MVADKDIFRSGDSAGVAATLPQFGTLNQRFCLARRGGDDLNNDWRIDLFATGRQPQFLYLNKATALSATLPMRTARKILLREPRRSFSITTTTATRTFRSNAVSRFF